MIDIRTIPAWLLGVGVVAIAFAAIYVFVFPGKGIEINNSGYFGPYRANNDYENIAALAKRLDKITNDKGTSCIKFKENTYSYCFQSDGNFVSFNANGVDIGGLAFSGKR